jgi:hypothetical protein
MATSCGFESHRPHQWPFRDANVSARKFGSYPGQFIVVRTKPGERCETASSQKSPGIALCFMRLRSLAGGRGDHMAFAVVGPGLLCRSRWPEQGIIGVAESLAHSCRARVPLCVCAAGQQQPSGPSTQRSARCRERVELSFALSSPLICSSAIRRLRRRRPHLAYASGVSTT